MGYGQGCRWPNIIRWLTEGRSLMLCFIRHKNFDAGSQLPENSIEHSFNERRWLVDGKKESSRISIMVFCFIGMVCLSRTIKWEVRYVHCAVCLENPETNPKTKSVFEKYWFFENCLCYTFSLITCDTSPVYHTAAALWAGANTHNGRSFNHSLHPFNLWMGELSTIIILFSDYYYGKLSAVFFFDFPGVILRGFHGGYDNHHYESDDMMYGKAWKGYGNNIIGKWREFQGIIHRGK